MPGRLPGWSAAADWTAREPRRRASVVTYCGGQPLGVRSGTMNAAFTIGRIALVVIFIISGAFKFLDITGTAEAIQAKLVIPSALSDATSQIEATLNMPISQVLAIVVALIEVI